MKIKPEMADHPLSIAARRLDDLAEQMHLSQVADTMGLKAEDLMYIAEQRALRCVLLLIRKMTLEQIQKQQPMFALSAYEMHFYHMFVACEMDGMGIGWLAGQQQENKTCTQKNHQKK